MKFFQFFILIFLNCFIVINCEHFSGSSAMEKLAKDEEIILREFERFCVKIADESDYILRLKNFILIILKINFL